MRSRLQHIIAASYTIRGFVGENSRRVLSCGCVVGDGVCESSHALHVVIIDAGEEAFSRSAPYARHEGLAFMLDRDPLSSAIGW